MASKKGDSAGSPCGGTGIGKVGRSRTEERQSRLVTEGRMGEKRVTFRIEGDKEGEEVQERKAEMMTEVRKEIQKELKDLEHRWDKRLEVLSKEVSVGMENIENIKKRDGE